MLTCSLVHDGKSSLSRSRIQVVVDRFGQYPNDITIGTCRQCDYPQCLTVCPVQAISVDKNHMNARVIDEAKCIGCQLCIKACYFEPSRAGPWPWDPTTNKAIKCDLCANAPYWDPTGKSSPLACVEVCPDRALKFSSTPPADHGNDGYIVNLRGDGWKKLDLPVD